MTEPVDALAEQLHAVLRASFKHATSFEHTVQTWERFGGCYSAVWRHCCRSLCSCRGVSKYDSLVRHRGATRWLIRVSRRPVGRVDPLDEVYRQNTVPDAEEPMWSPLRLSPDHWWQRRVPKDERMLVILRLVSRSMNKPGSLIAPRCISTEADHDHCIGLQIDPVCGRVIDKGNGHSTASNSAGPSQGSPRPKTM